MPAHKLYITKPDLKKALEKFWDIFPLTRSIFIHRDAEANIRVNKEIVLPPSKKSDQKTSNRPSTTIHIKIYSR